MLEQKKTMEVALRRLLSFIVAAAIFAGGLWLLAGQFFWPNLVGRNWLWAAGIMLVAGGYWLLVDFIAPAFGTKVEE
jgi:hypothetical protein